MPRNACADCRAHKVKCIAPDVGGGCERCAARGLSCSNLFASPKKVHLLQAKRPFDHVDQDEQTERGNSSLSEGRSGRGGRRPPQYDIGDGTPMEILREFELSKEIIKLYFDNFSDVHFMFHQDTFMQEFARGGIPKIILYTMLALGIRYSPLTIFGSRAKCHLGEPLFYASRKLLKEEFDQPSITIIQAYILLATYHFTFGGARKGLFYLASASSMAKLLRIRDDHANSTPFRREMCRRLMCTLLIMDRTLSPSLNVPCNFTPEETINDPLPDNHLQSLATELFRLVCIYHRQRGTDDDWRGLYEKQESWYTRLPEDLMWTPINFAFHKKNKSLRKFLYIHLLYNHICQLIYFPFLQSSATSTSNPLLGAEQIRKCHFHAKLITEIIEYSWNNAAIDMHNVSMGQVLTVSAAIIMHARLTSLSEEEILPFQGRIEVIEAALDRDRESCRVFDRVSAQLDSFLQIFNQSSNSSQLFDRNQRLIQHILHYGTSYERADYRKTGQISGLQEPSSAEDTDIEKNMSDASVHNSGHTRRQSRLDSSETATPRMSIGIPSGSAQHRSRLPPQTGTGLAGPVAAGGGVEDGPFQNCAWMFSESSLNDLYAMPFLDASMGGNEFHLGPNS